MQGSTGLVVWCLSLIDAPGTLHSKAMYIMWLTDNHSIFENWTGAAGDESSVWADDANIYLHFE